jgi:predicted RNA-binding Zn ribbon-like protein
VRPLFLGSHPAIDFLNTSLKPRGCPVEVLGDGRSFAAWLGEAGLVDPARLAHLARRPGWAALDDAAADARRLREWARGWLARWREDPGGDYAAEVRHLNAFLARPLVHRELVAAPRGYEVAERDQLADSADLIGVVALQLALLVAREDPERLKSCAGAECTLWFLDRTKAGRRLYCSAKVCGNRAKVAAFRERQRGRR